MEWKPLYYLFNTISTTFDWFICQLVTINSINLCLNVTEVGMNKVVLLQVWWPLFYVTMSSGIKLLCLAVITCLISDVTHLFCPSRLSSPKVKSCVVLGNADGRLTSLEVMSAICNLQPCPIFFCLFVLPSPRTLLKSPALISNQFNSKALLVFHGGYLKSTICSEEL